MGLLADRAAPARLPDRPPGDAAPASTASSASRSTRPDSRRLEACQSPVWDTALAVVALADAGVAARPPGARCAPPTGCSTSRCRSSATGRCAGPRCSPAAGRSSSPTTTTPTSTTRPRSCSRCCASRTPTPSASRAPIARARRVARGDAGRGRRLGRVRRRQHQADPARRAVLRLRRGDRPAERRRHRARARDARRRRARRHERGAARAGVAERRAGGRRLVVRALGRQPRLRHRRRRAGAGRRRRGARPTSASGAPCAGSRTTRTPTAAGARTRAPTATPPWIGRGTSTASQTAWALLALHAAGERSRGRAPRRALPRRRPSAPTAAGTSRSTPAPASPATSTSTTTSTASSSRSWRWRGARGEAQRPERDCAAAARELLVLAPMRVEARAMRAGAPWSRVEKIGMGPRRARAAAPPHASTRASARR